MQTQGTAAHPQRYAGWIDVATTCYRKEGIKGFYKGLSPTLLKVSPSMGISWVVCMQPPLFAVVILMLNSRYSQTSSLPIFFSRNQNSVQKEVTMICGKSEVSVASVSPINNVAY